MNGYAFGATSRQRLNTVKPELRLIAVRALELCEVDFTVVQGGRTVDEQMRLYGKGRTGAQCKAQGVPVHYARPGEGKVTWTIYGSNHLVDKADGLGKAIDVCPFVNGKMEWDDNGKLGLWPKIAAAFKQAAKEQGVSLGWGGDWSPPKVDRPHFELK